MIRSRTTVTKVADTHRNEMALQAFKAWIAVQFPGACVWIRWQWRNWGEPRSWFEVEVS